MRRTLVILALAAVTLMAATNDASAQRGGRRGGGGGRGWSNSNNSSWSVGIGPGGLYGGYNSGGYYGSGFYGGYPNSGYYGSRYYGGYPYYSSYGGYYGGYPSYSYGGSDYYPYYSGYTYSTPDYTYATPTVQAPEYRQSAYSDPNTATLTVFVPNADAQIWVDDNPTTQRGMERTFFTPGLQQAGSYTIKARWTEGGRTINQERRVRVQPGQSARVDFRVEDVPAPRTPPQP